jgi:hypothetical protein
MTIAVAIWQGAPINELGGMSCHSGAEEEPMHFVRNVVPTFT